MYVPVHKITVCHLLKKSKFGVDVQDEHTDEVMPP